MNFYEKELSVIKKSNRLRTRKLYDESLIDMASNDYLGLGANKKIFSKAIKKTIKEKYIAPKASQLVNGYTTIHKKFEKKLSKINGFEDGIIVGSGFLANISLIESMCRKKDILFIDQEYHASGIVASKLVQGEVVVFNHNDFEELENKIKQALEKDYERLIIAIEGVYSMKGDIAPKEFSNIANKYNALLIVDEAHSSGVIGENLLGWFDYWNLDIKSNYIKMGTLGKAYGSYGAYILASSHMISFLENRAKPIIYSTALSLIDTAMGIESLKYIVKNKIKLRKKIETFQKIVKKELGIHTESLILPIVINDNKKVLELQDELKAKGFLIGAIRQPTVKEAILRVILKLDLKQKDIKRFCTILKSF